MAVSLVIVVEVPWLINDPDTTYDPAYSGCQGTVIQKGIREATCRFQRLARSGGVHGMLQAC